MKLLRRLSLLAVALCVLATAAAAQGKFALRSGDRVVFYGDSITEQRLYPSFVETYVLTRFPRLNASFVMSGVGGDRVTGGWAGPIDLRLDRDAIPYRPTMMTVMLGMNDGSYRAFDQKIFDTYRDGYRHIIEKMKSAVPGIRMTLIQASPFDDVTRAPGFPGGYNSVLVAYGVFVNQLAREQNLMSADLNSPVVGMLSRALTADAALSQKLIPDRVHPGTGGHLIMAESLLKAWNAPALVSAVEIDATNQRVARTANASVSNLAATSNGLTWTETDGALPFPLDSKDEPLMLAVRSSDFVEALDQQPLKVTGLSAPRYALAIDGETIGSFTREELAEGINLAVLPTPMAQQAAEVHALTAKHAAMHRDRWGKGQANWPKMTEAEKRDFIRTGADEQEVIKQQRATAQPKPHKYTLTAE